MSKLNIVVCKYIEQPRDGRGFARTLAHYLLVFPSSSSSSSARCLLHRGIYRLSLLVLLLPELLEEGMPRKLLPAPK